MATSKKQMHIDSAGRLAAIMNDLSDDDITQLDVLSWCREGNILLANDGKIPGEAVTTVCELMSMRLHSGPP